MTEPEDESFPSERATWLTAAQGAEYLQVSRKTFRAMVRNLPIPFSRPAGPTSHARFFRSDIDRAMMSRRENLPAPPEGEGPRE